ncbi:MAG: peptide chain release factor 1 [Candidatus Omnitrophica bacterium]|nr:peptide chain release factor 1 [Candidatus Omnitrophota bacterium]
MESNRVLFDKFKEFERSLRQTEEKMAQPEVIRQVSLYRKLAKERSELAERIEKYNVYKKLVKEIERLEKVLAEAKEEKEFLELVEIELEGLREKEKQIFSELEEYLIEQDPYEQKDIIVEIRAGTGGEEAALFAADMFRMYMHYAESRAFKVEVINSNPTPLGGFKEIIFSVEGRAVYGKFKFESGVHRVQRVPSTEGSGRIHTSAVSVAVLPEAEDVDVQINPSDLKIDVYRSAGCGGQSVNTTDSAVRITHLPTGIVVTCQDERSQLKNKLKAMKVLKARLLDAKRNEQESKIIQERRAQIGTGDRSEKIRTYNFPDRRVTDHRIGLTLYKIERIIAGDLEEIVSALQKEEKKLKLSKM